MELIGRREQLALLDEALRTAHAGEPVFVVLGGEAGIGKTYLMEHLAGRLEEAGVRVLRGSCVELGTEGLPLAPFSALLRDLIRQAGDGTPPGLTPSGLAPAGKELIALLPESGGDLDLGYGGQARLFELFGALFERLGREGTLALVIDDLHWSDRSTRELIGFLVRRLRSTRVLITMAYRQTCDAASTDPLPVPITG
ncbi:ATP-binding protein [Nonomuraea sp. NPDC050404]|uniref:ATP-binding protein n=1 Tax=Nonomuraea sp. NPDC050404 TaxID=3155783 RepID=UPI0033C0AB8D